MLINFVILIEYVILSHLRILPPKASEGTSGGETSGVVLPKARVDSSKGETSGVSLPRARVDTSDMESNGDESEASSSTEGYSR